MLARGLALCAAALFAGSCEDPPSPLGAFILGIRTELPPMSNPTLSGGMGETLSGLTGLRATVTRVDVVHRTVRDDPSTERVLTIDSTLRTFELLGDLQDASARSLGFFNIPAGYVFQLRAITTDMSITLRGETLPVRIPSGEQTGIKIEPIDGVPFEMVAGERTGGRVVFRPFDQLIRNRGQGFMMKPVVRAEHVQLEELTQILLDRVVVRFKPGVTRAQIDAINASLGTTVIDFDPGTNYFVLHLPTTVMLADALEFYAGRSEVAFTLPDNVIYQRQVIPCDPQFQNPGPFTQVNAPQAWATTTGSRAPLLAVVDNSFDLANPDMLNNYFINQGELRGVAAFDANSDGTVTAAEVASFDTDGDGLITFVDLNAPPPAAIAGICPANQNPNPATCDPRDLVDGVGGNVGFEDGIDNDGNGRVDDLVGWDFGNNDNLVDTPGSGCNGSHGVGVASVVAAIGAPPPVPPAVCASGLVAGMNWVGRLLPVLNARISGGVATSARSGAYMAVRYAAALGADAINASWGITYTRGGDPGCNRSIPDLGDKYDSLLTALASEGSSLNLGRSVLVNAVDNCPQNDDSADIFDWPAELNNPNIVTVGAIQTNVAPPALATFSAFGPNSVDIVAPGTNFNLLQYGGGTMNCQGTSFAAPMVTGTVGLLLTNNANPPIAGNAATVISRLLCNATVAGGLNGQIGGGGRVLNVNASTLNSNGCP